MKIISILFVVFGITMFASVPSHKEKPADTQVYDFSDSPIIISVER